MKLIQGIQDCPPQLLEKLSTLSTEEIRAEIKRELEARKESERFAFFEPNGKQEEFIRLFGMGDRFISILSTANGVGKTSLVVNILGNLIWGQQNKFFDFPLFKRWPYLKRARYITESELVKETGPFPTEIKHWWPEDAWTRDKDGKTWFSLYKANGWLIDVMTYQQDVRNFEGGNIGLAIFDEPPPEDIWNATVSRMRKGGVIIVLMTPLLSAGWFFDRVVPRHAKSIVYADIEDNCLTHGTRGILDHDQIQRMIREWPPDEVEARAHGKAMYLKGLVYKGFDPKFHVVDHEETKMPYNSTVYQAVDPHAAKPFACVWGYPEGNDTLHIFQEWPNEDFYRMGDQGLTIKDYARIFREKEQGFKVKKRIMDRHFGGVRSTVNKRTLMQEFQSVTGINFEPSYSAGANEDEIDTGVIKVRSLMDWNREKPIDSINRPKLVVHSNCHNTIKAFTRWATDPKTGRYNEDFKDFMDAVRYLVMANPRVDKPWPKREAEKLWG